MPVEIKPIIADIVVDRVASTQVLDAGSYDRSVLSNMFGLRVTGSLENILVDRYGNVIVGVASNCIVIIGSQSEIENDVATKITIFGKSDIEILSVRGSDKIIKLYSPKLTSGEFGIQVRTY